MKLWNKVFTVYEKCTILGKGSSIRILEFKKAKENIWQLQASQIGPYISYCPLYSVEVPKVPHFQDLVPKVPYFQPLVYIF